MTEQNISDLHDELNKYNENDTNRTRDIKTGVGPGGSGYRQPTQPTKI